MDIVKAMEEAEAFKNLFAPACKRIEIVGSVKRRDKLEVHDIEILMILDGQKPRLEFGMKPEAVQPTMLDQYIFEMKQGGILREPVRKANGERYKKFAIVSASQLNDFCLDLFIVNEQTWGIQNVIRTGPSLFSHAFVTNQEMVFTDHQSGRRFYGLLPTKYEYLKGKTAIWDYEEVLALPEERDALALLGRGWVEPKDRIKLVREVVA